MFVELDRSVASPPGTPSLSETEKLRKGITRMINVLAGEAQNAGGVREVGRGRVAVVGMQCGGMP